MGVTDSQKAGVGMIRPFEGGTSGPGAQEAKKKNRPVRIPFLITLSLPEADGLCSKGCFLLK
jgi:hypothetical protein